jgi:hypothetical protein
MIKSNGFILGIAKFTLTILVATSGTAANADPIVNPALPIVERVNVAIIQVQDDLGMNAAPLFGTAGQTASIFAKIDQIWAQAGIDVEFISFRTVATANPYNSTFALTGTAGNNNPRPTGDLATIVANATPGFIHPDPNTLNLFVTRIVPGFSQTSDNTSNGLAFLGGNGITFWAGPNLPAFGGGEDVIASVLAHEIGHNLGLAHIVEAQNLMQEGGSPNPGERLNAAQIAISIASPFSVIIAVPEANSFAAVGLFGALAGVWGWASRRRSVA